MMIRLLKHTRRPDISFSRNGKIRISASIVRALSIRPGDILNIAVEKGEYLLFATPAPDFGRHHAQCYPTKKGSRNFCANSTDLCTALLDNLGITSPKATFLTGEPLIIENTKYLPIITLRPL